MKKPRRSLSGRLIVLLGTAAVVPLLVLTVAVLTVSYQLNAQRVHEYLEQVGLRFAAGFEGRLREKFGLLEALALTEIEGPTDLTPWEPQVKSSWFHREGQPWANSIPPAAREFYDQVRARGGPVLGDVDWDRFEVSLGVPLVVKGRFVGVAAMTLPAHAFAETLTDLGRTERGYIFLVGSDARRIYHPDKTLVGQVVGVDLSPGRREGLVHNIAQGEGFEIDKLSLMENQWSHQRYVPVTLGRDGHPWFLVAVSYDSEVYGDLNWVFLVLVVGVLATAVLVVVATAAVARSLTRPLRALADGADKVASGLLDAKITWASDDEIGLLTDAFNRMTDQVRKTLQDQDETVRLRTESLRRSLADLEQAQTKIIDSEKLALLGQLTATIAHEINTPLGAIRSSATFLHQSANAQFGDLPEFFRRLDEGSLAWFRALVVHKGISLGPISAGPGRKRRRDLAKQLGALGVEDPEGLADDISFLADPEEEASVVQGIAEGRAPVVRQAAKTAALVQASAIILEAADRAAKTVAALVDYSRRQELQDEGVYDPAKELDTLMTLYYGVAKQGVEVHRQYEEGLRVRADRDRLNQVWVNLINNAFQAMEYRGNLWLTTRTVAHGVEILVANDGPPVPEALKEKIFQPFFTTKRAGEGTGLGLDICRRIVEAHHGSLTLSEEGKLTVFTVRLPLDSPPRSTP